MKFSLAACILALSALSTAQAACHRRSRRSYGDALIPANARPALAKRATSPQVDLVKKLVRRHKGGRRLDRERRAGSRETWAQREHISVAGAPGSVYTGGDTFAASPSASTAAPASTSAAAAAASAATTTSSSSSSASTPAASGSSSSTTYSGQATFFYQDGNAGACGTTHADSDKIVAVQTEMYGSGGFCGKTVVITNTDNGKSVTATVADECPGCSSSASLDLSTGTFDAIASEDTGEVPITWTKHPAPHRTIRNGITIHTTKIS
ncbi:hypothetical protein JCM10908_003172 [Rhodotorula pacifica]|uniref:RlpA-like double-psi beta-barrel domain-containing protein n=1 Tax=Rhodotorula pacifica TaxID=1495444 RepID=UPI00317E6F11